jgi:hypothetical protein
MSENRRQILQMLADGKVTTEQAERLLAALERDTAPAAGPGAVPTPLRNRPKYLRVTVDTQDQLSGEPTKVNIRVPMQLLRAGVRLSSLIPVSARDEVNSALRRQGVTVDINHLRPEHLEDLIEQLEELTVDVDQEHTKVRVFAE